MTVTVTIMTMIIINNNKKTNLRLNTVVVNRSRLQTVAHLALRGISGVTTIGVTSRRGKTSGVLLLFSSNLTLSIGKSSISEKDSFN